MSEVSTSFEARNRLVETMQIDPVGPDNSRWFAAEVLRMDTASRASMHAKCVIVDRRICLITFANGLTTDVQVPVAFG